MAEGDDVYALLRCNELDQDELERVLSFFYGHGHHAPPNEIVHGREQRSRALRTIYDSDGKLIKVLLGPDALPDDIDQLRKRIETDLLSPGTRLVRRQILFASVPTVGQFRYRDVLQILPLPPEAPRPGELIGDHPLLLEYTVSASPDMMVTIYRQQRVARELGLVLSSLLDFRVRSLGNYEKHWCLDVSDGQIRLPSKFLQEGYAWDGPQPSDDDFADASPFTPITLVEIDQYFARRGISLDSKLELPADLPQQLDRFFGLTMADREKFLRASYWFQHAGKVFPLSKSASFIALVSAVEVLMPELSAGEACPQCKQMIGTGPTRRFVEFVEATIPNSGLSNQERRRFYRVRSALAHGGKLLAVDHNNWGFTPKQIGEDYDARTMWKLVQIVLHNWLAQR